MLPGIPATRLTGASTGHKNGNVLLPNRRYPDGLTVRLVQNENQG